MLEDKLKEFAVSILLFISVQGVYTKKRGTEHEKLQRHNMKRDNSRHKDISKSPQSKNDTVMPSIIEVVLFENKSTTWDNEK